MSSLWVIFIYCIFYRQFCLNIVTVQVFSCVFNMLMLRVNFTKVQILHENLAPIHWTVAKSDKNWYKILKISKDVVKINVLYPSKIGYFVSILHKKPELSDYYLYFTAWWSKTFFVREHLKIEKLTTQFFSQHKKISMAWFLVHNYEILS